MIGNGSNFDMSMAKTTYRKMSNTRPADLSKAVRDLKAEAHKWYASGSGDFDRFMAHDVQEIPVFQNLYGSELGRTAKGDEALVIAGYVLVRFTGLERSFPFCVIATGDQNLEFC